MTAKQALEVATLRKPDIDKDLYADVMKWIIIAASDARTCMAYRVDADLRAQDELVRHLMEDGYKVDWDTTDGPRNNKGGFMMISWKEAK